MKMSEKLSFKKLAVPFAIAGIGLFTIAGCSSDDSVPVDEELGEEDVLSPPDAERLGALREASLDSLTQKFILTKDDFGGLRFTSEQDVEVYIDGNCLTFDGESLDADDEVEAEFIELYDRGNLLTTNIATMGRDENGDASLLITGGAFYLNLYKDSLEVDDNCGFNMEVPAANTGDPDDDMILWYGEFNDEDEDSDEGLIDGGLVWEDANGDTQGGGEFGISYGEGMSDANYDTWSSKFEWTNVDKLYNYPGDKTQILVTAPDGYDASNTSIYLSYDGELGLARLDYYDEETGYFNEHAGLVPIDFELHVIMVSESEGEWLYAIKPITMEEDMIIEFSEDELDTASEDELTDMINDLP